MNIDTAALIVSTAGVIAGLAALLPQTAKKARIALAVVCVLLIGAGLAIGYLAQSDGPGGTSGKITSPRDGTDVQSCAWFKGTAEIGEDQTLILAVHNLTTGDPTRYVEYVQNWRETDRLGEWSGAHYFNEGALGQDLQVELIAVDLAKAERNVKAPDFGNGLANTGKVLAKIRVHRVSGSVPGDCEV